MPQLQPYLKPADYERTNTHLGDAKKLLLPLVGTTQTEFAENFLDRKNKLISALAIEDIEAVKSELDHLVTQVSGMVITALQKGKGKKGATVVGEFKETLRKIENFHRATSQLTTEKTGLELESQKIDLASEDDLELEIEAAKALRPKNDIVKVLEATLFALQQEINGVLIPRLSGLIQSQWGEANADLQMAHLQLTRAKALTSKKTSKVPSVETFKR